jgi:hypothetical protein
MRQNFTERKFWRNRSNYGELRYATNNRPFYSAKFTEIQLSAAYATRTLHKLQTYKRLVTRNSRHAAKRLAKVLADIRVSLSGKRRVWF